MNTPDQTLRNLSAEELVDHLNIGGTLPPGAIKELALVIEEVNAQAYSTRATPEEELEVLRELTERPLARWWGES